MGNRLAKIVLGLGLPFFLTGCNGCEDKNPVTMQMKTGTEIISENLESRYEVTRVEIFGDNLAYEGKRGIYEIIDHKTGKHYFGISGIGITEIGSHTEDKTTVKDER